MTSKEFALSLDAADAIRLQLSWITSLFSEVKIQFQESDTTSRTKIEWVTLSSQNEDLCEKTKNYITSLTNPNAKAILTIPATFKAELMKNDSTLLKSFERESGAVITLTENRKLSLQGIDELTVVLARSLLDEAVTKHKAELEKDDVTITKLCESVKQFALKLGYDDDDIKSAVESCTNGGKKLNENTLLQELVESCPQKLKETVFKSNLTQDDDKLFTEIARTIAEVTTAQTTTASSATSFCDTLRDIVIDGSNVAMCHGHKETFSCAGIEIVVNWFKERGHKNIVVFVPQWRQEAAKPDSPITDQHILMKLQKEKKLVFTPSRRINGRRVVCYDDRYIVKYAVDTDSVIVSNDNFRDLYKEKPEWKSFLEQRLLLYSFVNDHFMPPDDPLGRCGPSLSEFLKKGSHSNKQCPFKNKCTYGSKCRFYHPEKDAALTSYTSMSQTMSMPISSVSDAPFVRYNSSPQTFERNSPSIPYTSCAVEHQRQFDMSSVPHQEIIARGYQSISADHNDRRRIPHPTHEQDWQQQQQLSTGHLYHQQHPYYSTSTQPPLSSQSYMQSSNTYSMPPAQPHPAYERAYYVQKPSYSHQMYNSLPQRHTPTQPPNYMQQQQSMPAYSSRPPTSSNLMPGYVDPRMVNRYYRTPDQIHSQYVLPLAVSVETPLVQERRTTHEYFLRSDPYTLKEDGRLHKLAEMFPDRVHIVRRILMQFPHEMDMNILASHVLSDS